MTARRRAPYGSWKSPLTAASVAAGNRALADLACDGAEVYWVESRPAEEGRCVVVRWAPGEGCKDVTPAPFSARTRVHEYGGGAFAVAGGTVFFSNDADQRLHRQDRGEAPRPLTPDDGRRFADLVVDRVRGRVVCVCEDRRRRGEPENLMVAVALEGGEREVLVSGRDFFAAPRLAPDGSRLAWLAWDHPDMPWDATELWVADLADDGTPGAARVVAGGPGESIVQPEWSPDGVLYFVSDRGGFWNLHRLRAGRTEALCPREAEFGRPHWVFGTSTYAFAGPAAIVCAFAEQGTWQLARLDPKRRSLEPIATPYTQIASVRAARGGVVLIAGSPTEPLAVVRLGPAGSPVEVLARSSEVPLDSAFVSRPEPVEFPTQDGLTAHAFFYRPRSRDFEGPAHERPPLLVRSHGGPTSATSSVLSPRIQYWTSRGLAVVDVNYGGSAGFGRAYRDRLVGRWGVVDVDDCVNAARYLARRGEVDGERMAITGGSAGGYTTLCALTFRDVFRAGASYYGVSDLEALTRDTHKFESRYNDRLVGPHPERRDLYRQRSPIHFADRIACPVVFFQGLEDRIVPPAQAEAMVAALRAKGLPVAYLAFEDEGHGFRRAENIARALEAELAFYARIFAFTPADPVEPLAIENA